MLLLLYNANALALPNPPQKKRIYGYHERKERIRLKREKCRRV
jgi:hypothetical protein